MTLLLLAFFHDLIRTESTKSPIPTIIQNLSGEFVIIDLSIFHYFLRIEVDYFPVGILLSQTNVL